MLRRRSSRNRGRSSSQPPNVRLRSRAIAYTLKHRAPLTTIDTGNRTRSPGGHGGTTGPYLLASIIAHERLTDITRRPSTHKFLDLGANDGAAAMIAKSMAPNLTVDSIEIDTGRHLEHVSWQNRITADLARRSSHRTRTFVGWNEQTNAINNSFTNRNVFDLNAISHCFLNNFGDIHRGKTQLLLEKNMNDLPVGSTVACFSPMFLSNPGSWHESAYYTTIPGCEMPFERPVSNVTEEKQIVIYFYELKDTPQYTNRRQKKRGCPKEHITLPSFPKGTFPI